MTPPTNPIDINVIQYYKGKIDPENYNDFIRHLMSKDVSKVYIDTNYHELVSVTNNHYFHTDINPLIIPSIVEKAGDISVPVYFIPFSPITDAIQHWLNLAFNVGFPLMALVFIGTLFTRGIGGMGNMNNMNILGRNTQISTAVKPNVSIESWAGSPEVIDECREVVSFLQNKEAYDKMGCEMPRGILLEGPPGTGKTLLAKAIATETNSTFISVSGSEFVEIFVGMGAAKVRDLFRLARENRPSIVFIDEIDAVGKQRGMSINSNDEREQTLNQILYEMDGFNDNEDVLIMAATNRRDVLDKALLRPGRFDRIIRVPLPDKYSREKILSYYLDGKQFNITEIADLTDGLSGAQLKNLVNEAAILSVRNNYTEIQEKYMFDAFEKSIVGLIKTHATPLPTIRKRVAIHESGHLLMTIIYKDYFDFKKASIQPTYEGAGGYTIFAEKPEYREGGLYTKDILKKRLVITMAGKAAESVYYGYDEYVSLGCIMDLKQANDLARRMICNYGMGDLTEVFYDENTGEGSLGYRNMYSENTKAMVDKESLQLVREAYMEAKRLLSTYSCNLIYLSEMLVNNTVVFYKDIPAILL